MNAFDCRGRTEDQLEKEMQAVAQEFDALAPEIKAFFAPEWGGHEALSPHLDPHKTSPLVNLPTDTEHDHHGYTAALENGAALEALSLSQASSQGKPYNAALTQKLAAGYEAFGVAEQSLRSGNLTDAGFRVDEARRQLESYKELMEKSEQYQMFRVEKTTD
jgi:hypothetical protein